MAVPCSAAARLARHFVRVFEPYEAVVAPSGSCAAMVRHWYPQLLDGSWRDRAEAAFKATALALKQAVACSGFDDVPSTKGTLDA